MRKLWHDEAWEEYLYWQSQDKKTLKKINRLLTDIDRNGYQCTGKPEPLGENLAGYWSVRIDEKNRIVFQVILPRPFARTRVGVSPPVCLFTSSCS
jgi:toxin YoeB